MGFGLYDDLAVLAGFVFLYSIVAGRIERMTLSGPIIFIVFGFIAGPTVLSLIKV